MDLKSKVVLITGGTGSLGRALAEAFLKEGAKVCLADLSEELGESTIKELGETFESSNIFFSKCDVTKDESFEEAFQNCESKLGSVNILINNAGVLSETNWQKCIDVNLGGTIRGCQLALKKLGKHNGGSGGHVINIGSVAGLIPNAAPIYTSSKGGIVMYTRSIGMPLHFNYTGVSFQCICPTQVDTPLLMDFSSIELHEDLKKPMEIYLSQPRLKTDTVAESALKLLRDGKPGAVMALSSGKDPVYVEVPVLWPAK